MPLKKNLSKQKNHSVFSLEEKVSHYFENSFKKIRENKTKQFSFFILGFLIFYFLFTGIFFVLPALMAESSAALPLAGMLSIQGYKTDSYPCLLENKEQAFCIDVEGNGQAKKQLIISWLCSGALEIIVLVSAILASFGVKWKKKFLGAIIAVIVGYLFNLLRIGVTANIILSQSALTAELAHDFLFRIMLFIYIIVFYVVWFNLSVKKEKKFFLRS